MLKYLSTSVFFLLFTFNCHSQSLEFIRNYQEDSLIIHVRNNFHAPATLFISAKSDSIDFLAFKDTTTIPARDSVVNVIRLDFSKLDTSTFEFGDWVQLSASLGNPRIKAYDAKYDYGLPFPREGKYKIMQGFGGSFSHNTPKSRYAIDFTMPIGDTIYAAREGKVVQVIENFKEHGGRDMIDKANKIVIYHEDATLASYVHLDFEGALVEAGEQVQKGQAIGIAGWTGFSTKPHLHFVVRTGDGLAIPIRFAGYGKKELKQGRKYKHRKIFGLAK